MTHKFGLFLLIFEILPDLSLNILKRNVPEKVLCKMIKAVQRTAISTTVVFLEHFVFSQPDWYVEPYQNCTLPLVKSGKIGNTSCLIGSLNILGYMNML